MKFLAYVLMAVLTVFAVIMILGAPQGRFGPRLAVGLVFLAGAAVMGYLALMRPVTQTHIHKVEVDLPGNTSLEKFQCKQCGAELTSEAVTMKTGALFVKCTYCGVEYQLEEAAKW